MSFAIQVQPEATEEVAAIYAYYEQRTAGLGDRFQTALNECYRSLEVHASYQVRKAPYRHVTVRKFPYRVAYEIVDRTVIGYQVRYVGREPHPTFGP